MSPPISAAPSLELRVGRLEGSLNSIQANMARIEDKTDEIRGLLTDLRLSVARGDTSPRERTNPGLRTVVTETKGFFETFANTIETVKVIGLAVIVLATCAMLYLKPGNDDVAGIVKKDRDTFKGEIKQMIEDGRR